MIKHRSYFLSFILLSKNKISTLKPFVGIPRERLNLAKLLECQHDSPYISLSSTSSWEALSETPSNALLESPKLPTRQIRDLGLPPIRQNYP
ncbi:unnamed protein product, partial [Vitis vinifera]